MNTGQKGKHVDYRINHLSLCSGYGGIDLGLQDVFPTCRTIAYVEIEAFACANLVAKMEEGKLDSAPIWTNLRTFDAKPLRGHVGILSGGFPCQPFSQAGSRKGDKDPRHLFPEFERIIDECRPDCVFLENVEGIITVRVGGSEETSVLKHVLERLECRGYETTWGLFSAEEVGAPHLRNRVFILALADSDSEWWRREEPRQPKGNDAGQSTQDSSGVLADTDDRRSREDQQPCESWTGRTLESPRDAGNMRAREPEQVSRWPARPSEGQHDWEEPRTTQPGVGRATDGIANRLDRLRLLGNGVVPKQATRAFVVLMDQLVEGDV